MVVAEDSENEVVVVVSSIVDIYAAYTVAVVAAVVDNSVNFEP